MKSILIDGMQIGGAERRAVVIFAALRAEDYPIKLLLSRRLRDIVMQQFPISPGDIAVYDDYPWSVRLLERAAFRLRRHRLAGLGKRLDRFGTRWRDRHLAAVLAGHGIDCVHIFLDPSIGQNLPIRTIIEVTGPDHVDRLARWEAFGSRKAIFHAVNETVHALVVPHVPKGPVLQPPITFFDLSRFPQSLPFAERRNEIVFAHRFLPRKNGLLFARVAARFLDETPGWTVKILGRGKDDQAIRTVLACHIESGRAFVGYKSPIFDDLATAKIFVSVITPNNYPSQSVLEALAFGNALLLSDTGTSVARFLDGNGVSCTLDDDDALAALKRLTADQDALERMGARSRQLVGERYDKAIYLRHIRAVYEGRANP